MAQHLKAAANADYGFSPCMFAQYGTGHAAPPQFVQVIKRGLGARQDNNVGLGQIVGVSRIEKSDTSITLQGVEIGEVAQMMKKHHGNFFAALHLSGDLCPFHFPFENNAVFSIYCNVVEGWNNAQDRNASNILKHLPPFAEQTHVTPEFVYDDSTDELPVLRPLQGNTSVARSKHASAVNVGHQDDRRTGMTRH